MKKTLAVYLFGVLAIFGGCKAYQRSQEYHCGPRQIVVHVGENVWTAVDGYCTGNTGRAVFEIMDFNHIKDEYAVQPNTVLMVP